jgi:hypothetical protein
MDAMLRTFVLLATHLTMLATGAAMMYVHTYARRQQAEVAQRIADVRELFINETIEKRERRLRDHAANPAAGRHRARPVPALTAIQPVALPSLLNASLEQAQVILSAQRARREQDRRQFVDIMAAAQLRTYVRRTARVA